MNNEAKKLVMCTNITPFTGNTIAPPLEKERSYEIRNEYTCKCGELHYDVGLHTNNHLIPGQYVVNFVTCYKCREELPFSNVHTLPTDLQNPVWWCHSSRFKFTL
jgi:hypothetical protein